MTSLIAALSFWDIAGWDILTLVMTVLWLIVLEGLLSADNALVLAVLVRHLPKDQQRRALRYGIIGAFGFRLIAILLSAFLLKFWIFELVGGGYLIYLAARHFLSHSEGEGEGVHSKQRGFWATVVSVELADIAFSIDSILAAVALSRGLPVHLQDIPDPVFGWELWIWVVFLGGVLGIVTMRFVAGYFILLLEKFPALASGAYLLVAWIGFKLIGGGLHRAIAPLPDWPIWNEALSPVVEQLDRGDINGFLRHWVPEWAHGIPLEMTPVVFWTGMALIIVGSMLYKPRKKSDLEAALKVVSQIEEGTAPQILPEESKPTEPKSNGQ